MTAVLRRRSAFLLVVLSVSFAMAAPGWTASDARVDRQAWVQTSTIGVLSPQQDRVYVAAVAGSEGARTLIHVDASGLDEWSFADAELVLFEDAADGVAADRAALSACALAGPFTGSGRIEGEPPPADCTLRVEGRRTTEGLWRVELAVFGERWTTGQDYGLVLFSDSAGATSTFRVSLDVTKSTLTGIVVPEPGDPKAEPESQSENSPPPKTGGGNASTIPSVPRVVASADTPSDLRFGTEATVKPASVTTTPAVASPEPLAGIVGLGRDADSPPAFGFMLVLLVVAALGFWARSRRRPGAMAATGRIDPRATRAIVALIGLGVALLPLRYSELTVFKAGAVLIFVIAAAGLHILVNWVGQLSLAHASMVGLPAFVVLSISAVHDVSPLYLLPVGLLIGAVVGALVALPALRARSLQVALVTFAAGVGIERFFFKKTWLVGPVSGHRAATPSLGPFEFTTSKSLYPVVVIVVLLVALALWVLMHSRVGRAWFWIRTEPEAAAAFGVPVGTYKILAYATAGALAGISGALFVAWVPQFTGEAFPFSLSFDYLLVAVLAGPGYLGGVVAAVLMLQGGRLFFTFFGWIDTVVDYLGPVALIFNITKYPSGFHGLGRELMTRLTKLTNLIDHRHERERESYPARAPAPLSLSLLGGTVAVVAGFIAIALAWYHTGNTNQVWIQNQEMVSGGMGGLALVLVGVALLIRDAFARQQAALVRYLERSASPLADGDAGGDGMVLNGDAGAPGDLDVDEATRRSRRHRRSAPAAAG